MTDEVRVDLFAEDRAHEALLKPLIIRIARKEGLTAAVGVRSAQGGHGRAISEFRLYQRIKERDGGGEFPDVVVVAIDGNCSTRTEARKRIYDAVATNKLADRLVVACPSPHIERWYLADPSGFARIVGNRPEPGPEKCERAHYKRILAEAVRLGNNPIVSASNTEFGRELADEMNLLPSRRSEPSLKAFVADLRKRFRRLGAERRGMSAD